MKIYTSYFGNAKALAKAGVVLISIARWQPRFLQVKHILLEIAPTVWMLKSATSEQYDEEYQKILSRLDVPAFMAKLEQIGGGRDVALCCYEKPGDFCHRHVLAEYLTKQTGVEITEFVAPSAQPKPTPPPQPSLFDDL